MQCIIVFITLKSCKTHIQKKKVILFLIFAFSPKRNVLSFYQRMSCLLAISLKPKAIPPIPFWYLFLCFYHKKPPVPGINCSWINSVMLEQNHVKKASEIAMTAMAFSAAKLALWCLHDISTSKFKISFDRKNCVIDNKCIFFSILNGISGILVSYVSTRRHNSYFSNTFCMCIEFS